MKANTLLLFILISRGLLYSQTKIPCDSSLWQHIYNNYRLELKEECKTVTGTVLSKRREKDGDYHLRLRVDSGQGNLINEKNLTQQDSCLVIEIICALKITQTDAVDACENYVNNVQIPYVGEHITVTGSYVLDIQHGWMEIHPVTCIGKLQ